VTTRTLTAHVASRIQAIIDRHTSELQNIQGFVKARPGFPIRNGKVVLDPAVIVYVERKLPDNEVVEGGQVPSDLESVPTDTVAADVEMLLQYKFGFELESAALARLTYKKPPTGRINEEFKVTAKFVCHIGPDDGTRQLLEHLASARRTLTVAMYDFNATYILDPLVEHATAQGVKIVLTLDDHMGQDEVDVQEKLKLALPDTYMGWKVVCRASSRFPTAYHPKVAVVDSESLWLSSGNWTRRSQPDIDPQSNEADRRGMLSKANREWHVRVGDAGLAKEFENYVLYDAEMSEAEDTALAAEERGIPWDDLPLIVQMEEEEAALALPRLFPTQELPTQDKEVVVQPVLSPDNYVEQMGKLIQSAQQSLYIQLPYINYSDAEQDADFRALIALIGQKSYAIPDVRVIVGTSDAQTKVPRLVEQGVHPDSIKTQSNLHNKGFIVDGERVLVSSHNWSPDGVLRNRDAGLIIHDPEVSAYYSAVFEWDWDNRARSFIDSAQLSIRVTAREALVLQDGEQAQSVRAYLND
jgi:phosphatidylserine/phosphatidylglycerophosphate/cardiolipin synthase-like enzyme